MDAQTTPAIPTIPVEQITAQVSTAVQGIIDVVVAALPILIVIFVTIVSFLLVLGLVRRMAKGGK